MTVAYKTISADEPWSGFAPGAWRDSIDVRGFIQANYRMFDGDSSFLVGPTERTTNLWAKLSDLLKLEREKGVLDVSADRASTITAHDAGYIDRDAELIVGLQTDAPLKRAIMPFGGWRMVKTGLEAYGFPVEPAFDKVFPAIHQ